MRHGYKRSSIISKHRCNEIHAINANKGNEKKKETKKKKERDKEYTAMHREQTST
jgi:hypothetical protein